MSDVRTLLKKRPLLFDGGMGTYYKGAPGRECEQANRLDPEGIRAVHRAYLAAGADAIKTNTFGLPRMAAAQEPGVGGTGRRRLEAGRRGSGRDGRRRVCRPWPRPGHRGPVGGPGVHGGGASGLRPWGQRTTCLRP